MHRQKSRSAASAPPPNTTDTAATSIDDREHTGNLANTDEKAANPMEQDNAAFQMYANVPIENEYSSLDETAMTSGNDKDKVYTTPTKQVPIYENVKIT